MAEIKLRSVGVHDGTFHADEVTACALLAHYNLIDPDHIVRTREPALLEQCEYVCDVGGVYDPSIKRFDHHQVEYQGSWSSAGMVLHYLKESGRIDDETYQFLNKSLIIGVDDHDNGRAPIIEGYCYFSNVISNFAPIEYDASPEAQKEGFREAFEFVLVYLKRLLNRHEYVGSCREKVWERMQVDRECLEFNEGIPWIESFFELGGENHSARFILMPTGTHWKLRCIPPSFEDRMSVRHPLPEHWAGLLDEDLKEASGIPGAIFCHKGQFISVWETRQDAVEALEKVLDLEGDSR